MAGTLQCNVSKKHIKLWEWSIAWIMITFLNLDPGFIKLSGSSVTGACWWFMRLSECFLVIIIIILLLTFEYRVTPLRLLDRSFWNFLTWCIYYWARSLDLWNFDLHHGSWSRSGFKPVFAVFCLYLQILSAFLHDSFCIS